MKLPWLKSALEYEGPFLSLYFDTTRTDETAATDITHRWQQLRSQLESEGAPKQVLAQIEDSILRPSTLGGRHGLAVIAAGEDIVLNRVLPAPPLKDAAHFGERPQLLPLLQLTPYVIRQLLVEVDRAGADLHLRTSRDPVVEKAASVDGGHDELHKTSSGGGNQHGWRADNFQARVEDSWERNAEAVAQQVNKLVAEHKPDMVLLTGDVRAQGLLKAELHKDIAAKLQVVSGGTRGQSLHRPSFRAELNRLTQEFSTARQEERTEEFRQSQARDGASVGGAAAVAESLERGQVDELVFITGREPDNIEDLLHQAILTDAGVTALDDSNLDILDGVGALLRWKDGATPSNAIGSMSGDRARISATTS
ncbi:baeRF2 domain-containing protein [Corynebacterium sp. A21]|uniref:baeRF2 domain-containing protein n=1 Tax=Corynebacterium sp. A21 TaxID=3457318 RepID=UPI003FD0BB87